MSLYPDLLTSPLDSLWFPNLQAREDEDLFNLEKEIKQELLAIREASAPTPLGLKGNKRKNGLLEESDDTELEVVRDVDEGDEVDEVDMEEEEEEGEEEEAAERESEYFSGEEGEEGGDMDITNDGDAEEW